MQLSHLPYNMIIFKLYLNIQIANIEKVFTTLIDLYKN